MFQRHKDTNEAKADEHNTRSNQVCLAITIIFGLYSTASLLAPQLVMKCYGFVLDDMSSEETAILTALSLSLGAHWLLMTGLHAMVNGNGAPETTLKSTHHLSAVRTVLLTDAIWAAVRCVLEWVVLIPASKEQGWSTTALYVESAVFVAIGCAAFATSRGDKKSALGGLVKTELNAAALKIPEFNEKNDMFLFWIGVCAVSIPVLTLLPGTALNLMAPEKLSGASLSVATILMRRHGYLLFHELLTLVALVSSQVLALEYVACRWLWVWGFGACLFSIVCKEGARQLDLPTWPLLADAACYGALSFLAYKNLADFGKKTLTETLTGRTM